MASLLRVVTQGARCISANYVRQIRFQQPSCMISTSKKNKDALASAEKTVGVQPQENLLDKEEVTSSLLNYHSDSESDITDY